MTNKIPLGKPLVLLYLMISYFFYKTHHEFITPKGLLSSDIIGKLNCRMYLVFHHSDFKKKADP